MTYLVHCALTAFVFSLRALSERPVEETWSMLKWNMWYRRRRCLISNWLSNIHIQSITHKARGVATDVVGGVTPPPKIFFLKTGKFGQTKGKFGQTKGKFCHKWQHLWLLAHPIKFGQFYKNGIFGQFNEHTPPIKVVSRRPCIKHPVELFENCLVTEISEEWKNCYQLLQY